MSGAVRRLYKHASAADHADGFGVNLDAHALKTPTGKLFRTPTRALAEACAAEWEAQGEHIVPASMALTQLAFAALDKTPARRAEIAARVAKYIETDLVSHRAGSPAALAARQAGAWDPILDWGRSRFAMAPPVVIGVIAAKISPLNLTVLEWEIDDLDDFRCTALARATEISGSVLIGFALLEGHLGGPRAFEAAALDDLWSLEHWGEDQEARARLEQLRADLDALARFVAALA